MRQKYTFPSACRFPVATGNPLLKPDDGIDGYLPDPVEILGLQLKH